MKRVLIKSVPWQEKSKLKQKAVHLLFIIYQLIGRRYLSDWTQQKQHAMRKVQHSLPHRCEISTHLSVKTMQTQMGSFFLPKGTGSGLKCKKRQKPLTSVECEACFLLCFPACLTIKRKHCL